MRNVFRKVNLKKKKNPPLPLNPIPSLNILQWKKPKQSNSHSRLTPPMQDGSRVQLTVHLSHLWIPVEAKRESESCFF